MPRFDDTHNTGSPDNPGNTDKFGELDDLVSASLRRQAAGVDSSRPFGAEAYRRGRRIRTMRRAGAALACAALLAVGVPVGVDHLGGAERTPIQPGTSHSPDTVPSPAPTRPAVDVTVDLNRLPSGPSPRVPWYADGVIHDGDRTTPVRAASPSSQVLFTPVAGGYVVVIGTADRPAEVTRLVRADGTVVRTFPAGTGLPVVSADGRSLAWTGGDSQDEGADLILTDAATGADLARKRPDIFGPTPVGFLRGRLAFTDEAADGGATGIWDPGSGRISWLGRAAQRGLGTDGNDRLLVVTRTDPKTAVPRCSGLRDLTAGGQVWENCGLRAWGFLASGRYVAGDTGRDKGPMVVADARTGHTVLRLNAASAGNPVIEADGPGGGDGALLARITQGPRAALVRCTLSGRCELATPVRRIPHEGAGPVLPATFGPMAAGNVAMGGNAGAAGDAGAAGN